MKVFAVKYRYKTSEGVDANGLRIEVAHGLEDILASLIKQLSESAEGLQEKSLEAEDVVYLGIPELLARIRELEKGTADERAALEEIKE